jgi:hypothetical protein
MATTTNNVLAGKQPVPPTEAAHMLEKSQVQNSSTGIFATVIAHADFLGPLLNILQELTVRLRTVASEVFENARPAVG